MRRKRLTLLAGIMGAVLIATIHFAREAKDHSNTAEHQPPKNETLSHSASAPLTDSKTTSTEPVKALRPWDYYKPLTSDEETEFENVKGQIQKYLLWGKMDEEAVPAFRQTLFKMGHGAIAGIVRSLSELSKDDIKGKVDAEGIIRMIDELAYSSNSSFPLAADSVAHLARRPILWNESAEVGLCGVHRESGMLTLNWDECPFQSIVAIMGDLPA